MKTKRFLSVLLTAMLLLGALGALGGVVAHAEEAFAGYGPNGKFLAPIDPPISGSIPISSRADLEKIGKDPAYPLTDTNYHLTADIDLAGKEWVPIEGFRGKFDGQGRVIRNLTITGQGYQYNGLFGNTDLYTLAAYGPNATKYTEFINIGMEGTNININRSGNDAIVGGICGGKIEHGFYGNFPAIRAFLIRNCYNTGDISIVARTIDVGGIAGESLQIESCYNTGTISVSSSNGANAGGISSRATPSISYGPFSPLSSYGRDGIIDKCYNTGTVSVTGGYTTVGGIAGMSDQLIRNCYNTGDIVAVVSGSQVGGIVGRNTRAVTACYNTGTVSSSGFAVGGICGYKQSSNPTDSNCYWNSDIDQIVNGSPVAVKRGVGSGANTTTPLTSAQMKVQSNFVGFDFNDVWVMPTSGEYLYPVFKGQYLPPTTLTATFIDYDGTTKTTRTVDVSVPANQPSGTVTPPAQNARAGWQSLGWATSQAADAAPTNDFAISENTTFYGLYGRELKLSYETDGGTPQPPVQTGYQSANSFDIAKTADPALKLADAITHAKLDFDGWVVNTTGVRHNAGANITISGDTTVFPRWKARSFTVTYDRTANGGAGPNTTATVLEGREIDLTPTATKANHTFVGWNTSQNASAGLPNLTMGDKNVTLYAIFKPIPVDGVSLIITSWHHFVPDAYDNIQLKAIVSPDDAANKAVTWSSSNPAVATVDQTGFVKTLKPGTANITVKTSDGSFEAVLEILVTEEGTDITISKTEMQMAEKSSVQLDAGMLMAGAASTDVSWSSDNAKVATVDKKGLVNTHASGMAVITAEVEVDESSSVNAKFLLTVGSGIEDNDDNDKKDDDKNDDGKKDDDKKDDKNDDDKGGSANPNRKWWQRLPIWLQWLLRIFAFGWIWMRQ